MLTCSIAICGNINPEFHRQPELIDSDSALSGVFGAVIWRSLCAADTRLCRCARTVPNPNMSQIQIQGQVPPLRRPWARPCTLHTALKWTASTFPSQSFCTQIKVSVHESWKTIFTLVLLGNRNNISLVPSENLITSSFYIHCRYWDGSSKPFLVFLLQPITYLDWLETLQ